MSSKKKGSSELNIDMQNVDIQALRQEEVDLFLCTSFPEETERFAKSYLRSVGTEALRSKLFQQYVLLNLYFLVLNYAVKLGYEKTELDDCMRLICSDGMKSEKEMRELIGHILKKGIFLREKSSGGNGQGVIRTALYYMENNFADPGMTLKKVACVVNVSANHFSALFSQEMGKTFIEYLTLLRMARAKELLRYTDKRSGEIALEVGYKDPHYFSYLFKKNQGCTPSEYRNRGKGSCA